ncbi:hypothetical protein TorRG33x02_300730 [Trema orientale]|uniref:Uncharacterized protein n=1 Tax=Trema orientale TaxID=63057 RepID=A0A2P5C1Q3_TREOI|nr:hypothetical protein TorRG33x02_300730 [Trema orientale]
MKIKNKGKVYPSPSSSSSSSSNDREVVSVLKLLPAAILALASVLSLEDREVLAYMITRSIKTTSSSSSSSSSSVTQQADSKKKSSKKGSNSKAHHHHHHKPPIFGCDCFDCYTSYWFRWDSSPNRELIHQVIEAFEDHLTHGENSKKNNGRGKRRDKLGRREARKPIPDAPAQSDLVLPPPPPPPMATPEEVAAENPCGVVEVLPEDVVLSDPVVSSPERNDGFGGNDERKEEKENDVVEEAAEEGMEELEEVGDGVAVVLRTMTANEHKGLARKVLPDVLGLLNSRLWSLWSPNA